MLNLHDILIDEVKNLPPHDVALCLSSGVDSQSLLFAMLECGINPNIYSFTLEDRESRDFICAKNLANKYGLNFTKIELPLEVDNLIKDCKIMAYQYGAVKKTDFECLWPFLYLYPKIKEHYVVTGIPADGLFCLSKKGMIHFKDNVDFFRELYFNNPNAGQRILRDKLAKEYNKKNVDPYYSIKIREYLRGYKWDELNKPYQKMPIRNSFIEFQSMPILKHTNLQLGDSGISELFKKLLTTYLNDKGYKSVVGVYNNIIKQVNQDAQIQLSMEFD